MDAKGFGSVRLNVLYVVGVFLTWTVTSFLCHYYGKSFLTIKMATMSRSDLGHGNKFAYDWQPGVYSAFLLSCFQLGLCSLSVDLKYKAAPVHYIISVTCHILATFATNLSMAVTFASSTFAIKLTEPMTSALVQFVISGSALSLVSTLSLPIIVGGAIMFTGNPFCNPESNLGLGAALASNVFLSVRNVSLKQIQVIEREPTVLTAKCPGRHQHVFYVTLVLVGVVCQGMLYQGLHQAIALAYLSGIFHVLYSYTSVGCALQRLSVVTHAVTNICKRVFVVVLLYSTGQRQASLSSFFGLAVCTGGLLLYAWDGFNKTKEQKGIGKHTKSNGAKGITLVTCMVITFLLGIAFCNVIPPSKITGSSPSSTTKEESAPKQEFQRFDLREYSKNHHVAPGQQFETRTFSHYALTRPSDEMLMPSLKNLTNLEYDKISAFLNLDLSQNPESANTLMNQLRTNTDISREAQRIQFNVYERLLGKYKYAIWVGMAAFENKGDSCISSGEAMLMKRLGIEVIFFCHFQYCTEERLKEARVLAQKYSPDELVILNRGGGNLVGYYQNDKIRFMLINIFPDYQIVVLPQGIWVRNDDLNAWHVLRCIKKYCCSPNLTIILRDFASYNLAKNIFKGSTKLLLAPDSAFQFGPMPRIMNPVFDILWLKRDDLEQTPNFTLPAYPSHLRVHMGQWWRWRTPIATTKIESAYYLCTNGFLYLQRAKVIITDRLHGHILSLLSNIPHVVIDPKGKKITNFHNTWTKSYDRILVAKTPEEAMALAIKMLERYEEVLQPRMPFLHLREGSSEEKKMEARHDTMP